ncbi:hypothetical protein ENBRE01_1616 [Enteropsectra breve]|nr:hypothetical protein ENBRE01_1616 [Enteropsectra breve]
MVSEQKKEERENSIVTKKEAESRMNKNKSRVEDIIITDISDIDIEDDMSKELVSNNEMIKKILNFRREEEEERLNEKKSSSENKENFKKKKIQSASDRDDEININKLPEIINDTEDKHKREPEKK